MANGAQKAQSWHAEGIRDQDMHVSFHQENVPLLSPLIWGEVDEDLGTGEMLCNKSRQFSSIRFSGCSPPLTTDSLSRFWFQNRCLIYSNFISCHFGLLREREKLLRSPASLADNSPRRPSGLCKEKGNGSPLLQHRCPVTPTGSSILHKTLNPHTKHLKITKPRLH